MKNSALKGGILVAFGASSYGVLTTFVKMSYEEGFTIFEVTFAQVLLGFLGLVLLDFFRKKKPVNQQKTATKKNILHLALAGTSLGLTSTFYYLAVQYISVSIGIVLLMQSVWMGVVADSILNKQRPGKLKILAVFIVIIGTLLATNVLFENITVDLRGIGFGLLAATSYTVTIYTSNSVALHLPSIKRSKWMLLGALTIVSILALPTLIEGIDFSVFYKWGIILALFGTILPPLFLTTGMPKVNVGLGAIITSIELPVAVSMAYFLLGERVNIYQWLGIILILTAIVVMNLKKLKRKKQTA
ncbi:EamA family transporter [Haloflavibacter putidus]|uniref:DMT family transporter n=1 Tax=Haloflavibacter putidus TaxID=2576776 RepID=A0A507ZUC3_9FLAO|nr:DMT family transporter [Haloflavibacter putidus]TQD40537.1 DMT family transporter [Haloflavibacter putidus]